MEALDQQLVKVATELYRGCGTKVADACAEMLKQGDLRGLVAMTVNPLDYSEATLFERDYVAVSLLKKTPFDIPGVDRQAAALENFFESERRCTITNTRFQRFNDGFFYDPNELRCVEFLDKAKSWISRILGQLPVDLDGRFGPGSTFEDRGLLTAVPDKMSSVPTITEEARCLLQYYHETWWYRCRLADKRQIGRAHV